MPASVFDTSPPSPALAAPPEFRLLGRVGSACCTGRLPGAARSARYRRPFGGGRGEERIGLAATRLLPPRISARQQNGHHDDGDNLGDVPTTRGGKSLAWATVRANSFSACVCLLFIRLGGASPWVPTRSSRAVTTAPGFATLFCASARSRLPGPDSDSPVATPTLGIRSVGLSLPGQSGDPNSKYPKLAGQPSRCISSPTRPRREGWCARRTRTCDPRFRN